MHTIKRAIGVGAALLLTASLTSCAFPFTPSAQPDPSPAPTVAPDITPSPEPTLDPAEGDGSSATIELFGELPEDGTTLTGLTYEEYAIEAYSLWYPAKSRNEVVGFVEANNAGGYMAQMSQQLCSVAATNPTATLGPELDDGTVLTEQQLADFRVLLTRNFCPSVK